MILTPKQKIVYKMREREGRKQIDIAAELNLSAGEVSRLLSRARARVATFIASCPGGERCEYLDGLLN